MKCAVYLNFDGNCKEAMNYYRGIFGGEFLMQMTYGEGAKMESSSNDQASNAAPSEDSSSEKTTTDTTMDRMMHMSLPLSDQMTLMACDFHPGQGPFVVGNNVEIVLMPKTKEDVDRLFSELSKEGSVGMPLGDMFWGSYFGTCVDKYGVKWMFDFATSPPKETPSKGEGISESSPVDVKEINPRTESEDRVTKKIKLDAE